MSDVMEQVQIEATPVRPARMDERAAWIKRVLGFDLAAPRAASAKPLLTACVARLRAVQEEALLYGELPAFAGTLREAALAVKASDPGAPALIEALEQQVAAMAGAKRAEEAAAIAARMKTPSGLGIVAFAKLRLRLDDARSRFAGAIDNLRASCEALLESDGFATDPRSALPETLAAVAAIGSRVPPIGALADALEDAIDRMVQTQDPPGRAREAQGALAAIISYRTTLDAEPLLTEMESTEAGSFAIHSTMSAVLDELSAALNA